MPFKDPDPTDPNMLIGVMLPADAEATRDMAYVFAEEFARLGYSREQLLGLFKILSTAARTERIERLEKPRR